MTNTVQKFLLNDLDVRGALVSLDTAWQTVLARRDYPDDMAELLGQATVATLLMSTSIKYDGQLMLQLQSPKALSLLVVQNDNHYHFRSLAQYKKDYSHTDLREIASGGLIAMVVEAEKGKTPYQGVVSIEHQTLAENLETYFNQSEQLQTLLVLRADKTGATGILLQVMPGSTVTDDDWVRLRHVSETLNVSEMKATDSEIMISRIFAEDDKTVYAAETAEFECTCSDARTLAMLANLDNSEIQEIVDADESVVVSCDFCGQQYTHDAPTIAALLSNKIHPN